MIRSWLAVAASVWVLLGAIPSGGADEIASATRTICAGLTLLSLTAIEWDRVLAMRPRPPRVPPTGVDDSAAA